MAVAGRGTNEMATVHLIRACCLPSVTYGCEVWSLNKADGLGSTPLPAWPLFPHVL